MASSTEILVPSARTRAIARPIETLTTRPRAAAIATGALFAAIFTLRLTVDSAGDGATFLYVVPITIAAVAFGRRGGLLAGGIAFVLASVWMVTADTDVTVLGFLTRAAVYALIGALIGGFATTLRDLREESDRAFELSPDLICVIDFEGRVTRVNPTFERKLGYDQVEVAGCSFLEFVHPDDRRGSIEIARAVSGGRRIDDFENRCIDRDGGVLWLEWSLAVLADEEVAFAVARDVTERKALEGELERLSQRDSLTGLFNRRRFSEELDQQMGRARRRDGGGAVLLVDLDRFKAINDSHGHAAGDEALRVVARILDENLRGGDTLARVAGAVAARFGGDEFVALLPDTDEAGARAVAERIVAAVCEAGPLVGGQPLDLGVSIGVGMYGADGEPSAEGLLAAADRAMYRVKAGGGGAAGMADFKP